MLGYVMAEKAELKMREFEVYSGYYCGLCKSVGARYGQISRFTLSYDFAFLALLLASLDEENDQIQPEHCLIHPIKKKNIVRNNKYIDYAGDMMLILVYYNLIDDVEDEGSLKARVSSSIFHHNYKKLRQKYAKMCQAIETQLENLKRLERERCKSIDKTGETFAVIMGNIFTGMLDVGNLDTEMLDTGKLYTQNLDTGNSDKKTTHLEHSPKALFQLGKSIGKWIYLADAWDDIEKDIEKGSYNPLIYRFDYNSETHNTAKIDLGQEGTLQNESTGEFCDRIRNRVEFSLMSALSECSKACDLLEIKKNQGIIENIIYFGLLRKTEQLLNKKGTKDTDNERSI